MSFEKVIKMSGVVGAILPLQSVMNT